MQGDKVPVQWPAMREELSHEERIALARGALVERERRERSGVPAWAFGGSFHVRDVDGDWAQRVFAFLSSERGPVIGDDGWQLEGAKLFEIRFGFEMDPAFTIGEYGGTYYTTTVRVTDLRGWERWRWRLRHPVWAIKAATRGWRR